MCVFNLLNSERHIKEKHFNSKLVLHMNNTQKPLVGSQALTEESLQRSFKAPSHPPSSFSHLAETPAADL